MSSAPQGWLARLRSGLGKSSEKLGGNLSGMFGGGRAAPPPAQGEAPAAAAPPAGGPPKMTVDKVWQEGDVGFVNWHMGPVKATEEFLVRNGKIAVQSVFMAGGPPAAHS